MGRPERFNLDRRDLVQGASAELRLLAAVHRRFRRLGGSPSFRDLNQDTGIAVQHIGGLLTKLQLAGYLHLTRGKARSIVLVRRGAMLSDVEFALEAQARGASLHWPDCPLIADQLHGSYSVLPDGTDLELGLNDLLGQIDDAEEGTHGSRQADERSTDEEPLAQAGDRRS